MKLLREIDALTATFDHRDNGRQVTIRPFQTFDYAGMGLVLHDAVSIPRGGIIATKFALRLVSMIGSYPDSPLLDQISRKRTLVIDKRERAAEAAR